MVELTYHLNCDNPHRGRASFFLRQFAAITGICLKPSWLKPDIYYGVEMISGALNIPLSNGRITDKWKKTKILGIMVELPDEFIEKSSDFEFGPLAFDIFSVAADFVRLRLVEHGASNDAAGPHQYSPEADFNSYMNIFFRVLQVSAKIPQDFLPSSPWPGKAPYALGVSHDIDILKRKVGGSIIMLLRSLSFSGTGPGPTDAIKGLYDSIITSITKKENPYCRFGRLFDSTRPATLFLFSGQRKDRRDPTYKIGNAQLELSRLDLSNIEVALHNGIGTWNDSRLLNHGAEILAKTFNCMIKGIRPHYLDCRLPDFWKVIEGFQYSSSAGSDAAPGFKLGIDFPFFAFDPVSGANLEVLEIPIGLMDCALFSHKDEQVRQKIVDGLLAKVRCDHGLLVLDWHNTSAYEIDFPGWLRAFKRILDVAAADGAYIASLGQINDYWRLRCASVYSS